MVSLGSAQKICSYLVRGKLYLLRRFVGLRKCKKRRYKVCTYVTKADTFSSTTTGKISRWIRNLYEHKVSDLFGEM